MPMQRAKDSVGMEQAVRVHLYRTEVPKESRQSRERVTQRWRRSHSREGDVARALGHPSLGKDPYGAQEHTMSLTTRSVKRHAKARQRRRLHAQERLERDRRQAQQAAEALEQALQDLGWTCSHDTGHIWEEILPRPSESMSRTLKDLERQAFTVFWGMIHLRH
jgi:hypothetical protein